MSIHLIGKVFELQDVTPSEKLLLLALADFASEEGESWPKLSTLERRTGHGRRNIQKLLKSLIAKGYLSREVNGFAGTRGQIPEHLRPNVFILHIPDAPKELETRGGRTPGHGGGEPQDTGGANPRTPEGVNCSSPRTIINDPSMDSSEEPSILPPPSRVSTQGALAEEENLAGGRREMTPAGSDLMMDEIATGAGREFANIFGATESSARSLKEALREAMKAGASFDAIRAEATDVIADFDDQRSSNPIGLFIYRLRNLAELTAQSST